MANWQVISLDTTTPQLRAPGTGDGYSFNSGATQLGVWTTTGLGIGTASPATKLDVVGTAQISSSLTLSGGTANGVLYLNASKVATSGSALTYNGTEIGTTSTGLNINNANALVRYQNGSGTRTGYLQVRADAFDIWSDQAAVPMVFGVANAEQMRLNSTGLGIGTSSPEERLHVVGASNTSTTVQISSVNTGYAPILNFDGIVGALADNLLGSIHASWDTHTNVVSAIRFESGADTTNKDDGLISFWTSASGPTLQEHARITSGGEFLVATTTAFSVNSNTATGFQAQNDGATIAYVSQNPAVYFGRQGNDGTIVSLRQDGVEEGSISVSGNTISYNAFAGSHWSQLQDGSKPDILRGTVMESINELCVWPGEQNERLPKSKISDTAGSKKVYGVFMAWDNDWTETNDMYVTAVGAFICRVNGSVTVQEGDLLESNGDGTARVQADDIIRSSTIGKVTSTVKTHQYDDGSYCVPTVLYCG